TRAASAVEVTAIEPGPGPLISKGTTAAGAAIVDAKRTTIDFILTPSDSGPRCLRSYISFHRFPAAPGNELMFVRAPERSVLHNLPMLVLASQSPRRREILRQAGIPFT